MNRVKPVSLAAALLLAALLALSAGCGRHEGSVESSHDPGHEHGHEQEAAPAADDCGSCDSHAHGASFAGAVDLEAVRTAQCEHEVLTYLCDECRYEVGVVKLAPELLKSHNAASGLVQTQRVEARRAEAGLEATGEILLNDNTTVHVTPRVTGIVSAVHVDVGARVKKGAPLFEIESVEMGEALAAYLKSHALADLSRRNYERRQTLREQKITSEADVIESRMAYEEHQTELERAEQQLRVLGMTDRDISAARTRDAAGSPGRLAFRAPQDGVILAKHATVGEMIQPGDEVMLLADLSTVWVRLDVYEQDLASMLGQKDGGRTAVTVTTRAFPERTFAGEVDLVGAVMNEATRTVEARAVLPNPEGLLRPGMFCQARVALDSGPEVLAVPREAVLSDEGRAFVFKHMQEDYYIRWPVKTGREFASAVEIAEGLQPGETVVTAGAFLLKSDVLREKMGAGCAD
ncbi:MAG: efflux RND transporter periplasmic adaptor subunit [Candidatus Zixiibacteriota bacterium]|nr:MAG: efflux RND transporter periplasmic adaptor subunit [candidate division Zixibacteria bacterium]